MTASSGLHHGPINKTTFGKTAEGGSIRRMPNLVKFREDPDAMLVMALEEYDEVSGTAGEGRHHEARRGRAKLPRSSRVVDSAEEGLAGIALNDRKGSVDLAYIGEALREAGSPTSSRNWAISSSATPESEGWQTSDAYLSGECPGEARHGPNNPGPIMPGMPSALRAVQPEDVLPGDIDANLAAPWIPADDIRDFAAELFRRLRPTAIQHRPPEEGRGLERRCRTDRRRASRWRPRPTTARPGPMAPELLDLALNMKIPGHPRHRSRVRTARRECVNPDRDAGGPREAEAHQGAVQAPGSSPTP